MTAVCVVDTSALVAYLLDEPGADVVGEWLDRGAAVSALNLQELVSKIVRDGGTVEVAAATLEDLALDAEHDLTSDLALVAGAMITHTRPHGLSHGDRACLALARHLDIPAVTGDRDWSKIADAIGVQVELIR